MTRGGAGPLRAILVELRCVFACRRKTGPSRSRTEGGIQVPLHMVRVGGPSGLNSFDGKAQTGRGAGHDLAGGLHILQALPESSGTGVQAHRCS